MKAAIALGLPMALTAMAAPAAQLPQRCAACHLPSGAGVPAAFPPLREDVATLAAKAEGRRYLVLAITRGLSGPVRSGGQSFRGFMPAQSGMKDAEIADTLNIILNDIARAGPKVKRFTGAEVAQLRQSGATLSAAQVAALKGRIK